MGAQPQLPLRYYKDHHKDHELLQKLIKVEISRITSIPEGGSLAGKEMVIPINAIKWVEAVTIGQSKGLLEIDLRLYFSDDTYYSDESAFPPALRLNQLNRSPMIAIRRGSVWRW